jgi:peptidoglycan/xylan/chitin deacetylase (PgdA/CDA1 family)
MRVLTLEYHDVLATPSSRSGFSGEGAESYKMALPLFESHLELLKQTAGAGGDVRRLDKASNEAPVLITFDDGGHSAVDVIAPALERHGFVGHFFMTTSMIGAPGFLSATDLRELAARGHVIGSHSHSHPVRMARLTESELDSEWTLSKRVLEDILGDAVTVASVPGGYFSRQVAESAERAGIRWLFTSEPVATVADQGNCRLLGRYTLRRSTSPATLRSLLSPHGTGRTRQWLLWNTKKVAKVVAGSAYLRLRAALLGDRS